MFFRRKALYVLVISIFITFCFYYSNSPSVYSKSIPNLLLRTVPTNFLDDLSNDPAKSFIRVNHSNTDSVIKSQSSLLNGSPTKETSSKSSIRSFNSENDASKDQMTNTYSDQDEDWDAESFHYQLPEDTDTATHYKDEESTRQSPPKDDDKSIKITKIPPHLNDKKDALQEQNYDPKLSANKTSSSAGEYILTNFINYFVTM